MHPRPMVSIFLEQMLDIAALLFNGSRHGYRVAAKR